MDEALSSGLADGETIGDVGAPLLMDIGGGPTSAPSMLGCCIPFDMGADMGGAGIRGSPTHISCAIIGSVAYDSENPWI